MSLSRRTMLAFGAGVAVLTGLLTAPVVAVDPDPVTCVGYPQPRVYLDSQSWWVTSPGEAGDDFGHIHVAGCFPLQQTVSGIVRLDLKITMHENPGALRDVVVQAFGNGTNKVLGQHVFPNPKPTCAVGTCNFNITINADTRKWPYDGRTEWRLRPRVDEPDTKQMVASTSYQTVTANGKPVRHYRPLDFLQGKGWYTGVEYSQARLQDDQFPYNMPTTGTWAFQFKCDSTLLPLTECLVTIDPDFHAGHKGQVLYESFSGDDSLRSMSLNLDSLPPGQHKLVIRSGTDAPGGSTQYGILGVPFTVN